MLPCFDLGLVVLCIAFNHSCYDEPDCVVDSLLLIWLYRERKETTVSLEILGQKESEARLVIR